MLGIKWLLGKLKAPPYTISLILKSCKLCHIVLSESLPDSESVILSYIRLVVLRRDPFLWRQTTVCFPICLN
jgi:hypothetical protein